MYISVPVLCSLCTAYVRTSSVHKVIMLASIVTVKSTLFFLDVVCGCND
jgi:hypothetical protein